MLLLNQIVPRVFYLHISDGYLEKHNVWGRGLIMKSWNEFTQQNRKYGLVSWLIFMLK